MLWQGRTPRTLRFCNSFHHLRRFRSQQIWHRLKFLSFSALLFSSLIPHPSPPLKDNSHSLLNNSHSAHNCVTTMQLNSSIRPRTDSEWLIKATGKRGDSPETIPCHPLSVAPASPPCPTWNWRGLSAPYWISPSSCHWRFIPTITPRKINPGTEGGVAFLSYCTRTETALAQLIKTKVDQKCRQHCTNNIICTWPWMMHFRIRKDEPRINSWWTLTLCSRFNYFTLALHTLSVGIKSRGTRYNELLIMDKEKSILEVFYMLQLYIFLIVHNMMSRCTETRPAAKKSEPRMFLYELRVGKVIRLG